MMMTTTNTWPMNKKNIKKIQLEKETNTEFKKNTNWKKETHPDKKNVLKREDVHEYLLQKKP